MKSVDIELEFIPSFLDHFPNLKEILVSEVALDKIPDELKSLCQWVCWRKEPRDGKATKLPINPHTGAMASTTNPTNWGTCDKACEASNRYGYDGIGFVFTDDDPYAGVDLDKCRDAESGVLEPWAQEIVDSMQTFTEVSTSGTGVHCILRGHLPGARCRKGQTEMYDHERYFVMTGNWLADLPLTIEERQSELETLYAQVFQTDKDREDVLASKPRPEITYHLSDEEIIERAFNAKGGDKFRRLWEGDDSGYESRSEADAALCALLAFWTCHDPDWIDQLFRQSGLYRDKWERDDYREDTLAFAIEGVENYYDPEHYRSSSSDGETDDERAVKALERLKQLRAEWTPIPPDEAEPLTADIASSTENKSQPSSESVHARPVVTLEYFETIAQESGHNALCLPSHFGTMVALQRFICKHWYRGFVIATKTIEQTKRIASELVSLSARIEGTCPYPGGSLQDQILVLSDEMDTDLAQGYVSQPEVLLKRYPIIVTTHDTLLLEPPDFFLQMATGTDQAQAREFVIIYERPSFERIELAPAEYGLLCLATDGMDNVEDAIQCVQERMGTDNPHIQKSVTSLLALLAQVNPQSGHLSQLELTRAFYRLGVVIESRNHNTLNLNAGNYTVYIHAGLLQNPNIWIIDGTADLTLKASTLWDVERHPDCVYRLVCMKEPVLLEIDMIQRNLGKLEVDEGGIREKKLAVKDWIAQVEQVLNDLASQHSQILVVGWKDFKGSISSTEHDDVPLMESDSLEAVENALLKYLATKMSDQHPDMFVFTTYQPWDTEPLLEQCEEADAILFLGKFFIPPLAISELNRVNSSDIDMLSYSVAEIVHHTFRTRCKFRQPVMVYFTPDWGREFVQQFLDYTHATDVAGLPLSVFNQDEMLERKFKEMRLTSVQKRIVSQVLETYPEFEQTWNIALPKRSAMTLLGYTNVRNLRDVLKNLKEKDIYIRLIE